MIMMDGILMMCTWWVVMVGSECVSDRYKSHRCDEQRHDTIESRPEKIHSTTPPGKKQIWRQFFGVVQVCVCTRIHRNTTPPPLSPVDFARFMLLLPIQVIRVILKMMLVSFDDAQLLLPPMLIQLGFRMSCRRIVSTLRSNVV